MALYISLIKYTQQGMAKIKESPARLDAAKKVAEKLGGKFHGWYLTVGRYDAVAICEFPDDETGAKFLLMTGSQGNLTTETLRAFDEAAYRRIIGGLS
jgi:uncharacterized protein with GYD domain